MDTSRDADPLEGRSPRPWRLALCAVLSVVLVCTTAIVFFAYGPGASLRFGVDLLPHLRPEGEPNAWVAVRPLTRGQAALLSIKPQDDVRVESLIVWPLEPEGPARLLPIPAKGGRINLTALLEPELLSLGLGVVTQGATDGMPLREFSAAPSNPPVLKATILMLGSWLVKPPWDTASVHLASTSKALGLLPLPIAVTAWLIMALALGWMTDSLGRPANKTVITLGLVAVLITDLHWMGILTSRTGYPAAPLVPERAGETILNSRLSALEPLLPATPARIVLIRPQGGAGEFWEARTRFGLAGHRVMAGSRRHVRRLLALGVPFYILELNPDGELVAGKTPSWLATADLVMDTPQLRLWAFR